MFVGGFWWFGFFGWGFFAFFFFKSGGIKSTFISMDMSKPKGHSEIEVWGLICFSYCTSSMSVLLLILPYSYSYYLISYAFI